MTEKSTSKLNGILKQTHLPDFERFCLDNRDSMFPKQDYCEGLKT